VTGVDLTAPFADFSLAAGTGISGAAITAVTPVSGTTYTVNVNTGTGNGTLRLDALDDDSIRDAGGNPLGGAGPGNGGFSSGEEYTVSKSIPFAAAITRLDPSPTSAGLVRFNVLFTSAVSGVDMSDFTLTSSGAVDGASVTEVAGTGGTYVVTVNTGSGDGTLRLDLVDDDTIRDGSSAPLGGIGTGNANFNSGEAYTFERTPPAVTSSLRADPDHSASAEVHFTVTFTEPVSGVDAGDFALTAAGISEAAVTGVSGAESVYTITVGTGSGDGTLRLDLIDNDTVVAVLTPATFSHFTVPSGEHEIVGYLSPSPVMHYRVTSAPGKTVYLFCRMGYTSGLFMEAMDEARAKPLVSQFKYTEIEVKGAKANMDYKAYYDKLYR
jgi:hypothetical protein